ncbi:uncharacterized protein DMENIID0001_165740 [Sergentomyia squamirostris]
MDTSEKVKKQKISHNSSPKSLLDLNDDCLEKIFSYFTIRELIDLENVCLRFWSIAECFYKKQDLLEINVEYHSKEHIGDLAVRLGPYVSKLNVTGRTNKIYVLKFLSKIDDEPRFIAVETFQPLWLHCSNLKLLIVQNVDLRDHLPLMQETFKSLRVASMIRCGLTDEIGEYLKTADELHNLSLEGNPEIKGSFLPDLKDQLKKIDLSRCENIFEGSAFAQFCQNNLKLETLSLSLPLSYDPYTQPDTIMEHLDKLKKLESLEMIYDAMAPPSEYSPVFPKLKHLNLRPNDYLVFGLSSPMSNFLNSVATTDSVEDLYIGGSFDFDFDGLLPKFTRLVRFKVSMIMNQFKESHHLAINMESRQTLEHLDIPQDQITEEGLLEFVKDCPKLKYLNIRLNHNITDDFVHGLLPYLKHRTQCLELCCNSTRITEDMEKEIIDRGISKIHFNWNLLTN